MKSPYQLLGIPDSVAWLCVGVALIFALAPYLAGLDFGIFKIPTFDDRGKRRLKWIGPILIILSMVLFIPLESLKPPIPQLHVLPQDLILNLKDPYTSHQTIVGVDIQ